MYLADISGINATEIGAILVIFAGMLTAFYALNNKQQDRAGKDRDADRKERRELQKVLIKLAKSGERQAAATERGADEAKQRNGHLAELVLQGNKATNEVLARLDGTTVIAAKDKDVLISTSEDKK